MRNLAMVLIAASAFAFVVAVIVTLATGKPWLGVSPEAFSRASSNLSLIAIALSLLFKEARMSH